MYCKQWSSDTQYFDQKDSEAPLQYCKPEHKAKCFNKLDPPVTTK